MEIISISHDGKLKHDRVFQIALKVVPVRGRKGGGGGGVGGSMGIFDEGSDFFIGW